MMQTQNSSSLSKFPSDITVGIPIASLVPFPSSKSKVIFSKYVLPLTPVLLLSIVTTNFSVCRMRLIVQVMVTSFCGSLLFPYGNYCNFLVKSLDGYPIMVHKISSLEKTLLKCQTIRFQIK